MILELIAVGTIAVGTIAVGTIAVGTALRPSGSGRPPHRSERAELPHSINVRWEPQGVVPGSNGLGAKTDLRLPWLHAYLREDQGGKVLALPVPTNIDRLASAPGSWPSRHVPSQCHHGGRPGDLPVLAQRGSVHARGLRPRRAAPRLALSVRCVLPSASLNSVGALKTLISRLNTRPARAPVRCFTCTLAGAGAGLGVIVGRYSFDVELFHLLLLCRFIPAH